MITLLIEIFNDNFFLLINLNTKLWNKEKSRRKKNIIKYYKINKEKEINL
jgi:hypothetical protein